MESEPLILFFESPKKKLMKLRCRHYSVLTLLFLVSIAHAQPTTAPSRQGAPILQLEDHSSVLRCKSLKDKAEQARRNPGGEINRVPPSNIGGKSIPAPHEWKDTRRIFEEQMLSSGCDDH